MRAVAALGRARRRGARGLRRGGPAVAGETPRGRSKALKADEAARRAAAVAEAGRGGSAAPRTSGVGWRWCCARCSGDPDAGVRLAAVASLAKLADEAAWVPVLVAAITAKDDAVRAAATTAVLVGRGDLVGVARKLLKEDQDPTFRAEVALLLGRRRRVDAVPALLDALADKHPRVVTAAAEALEAVSGEAFGYEVAPWTAWWEKARVPPRSRARRRDRHEGGGPPEVPPPPPARGLVPDLYGLPLRAKDYVFVVDVSGSIGAEGLETAKGELVRAVERLPSDVRFAALFFDEQMRLWHPEMVLATPTHKADLARFVRGIPRGKRTDVMTPLNAGLAIVAKRIAARQAAKEPAPEPVTMVVVSDGQENVRSTPGDAVGDKLERLDLSHAVVHALVLGGKDNALMAALARRAGGVYRVVP
jgi:hypothetical protein